jgi:hypothetical protein
MTGARGAAVIPKEVKDLFEGFMDAQARPLS